MSGRPEQHARFREWATVVTLILTVGFLARGSILFSSRCPADKIALLPIEAIAFALGFATIFWNVLCWRYRHNACFSRASMSEDDDDPALRLTPLATSMIAILPCLFGGLPLLFGPCGGQA